MADTPDPENLNLEPQKAELQELEVQRPQGNRGSRFRTVAISDQLVNSIGREVQGDLQSLVMLEAESFSGPVPHPKIVDGYAKHVPDAGERFLRMAELEQLHRHQREDKENNIMSRMAKSEAYSEKLGQIFGFFLLLLTIVLAAFFLYSGFPIGAFLTFLGSVALYAGPAIAGRFAQRKKKDEKEKEEQDHSCSSIFLRLRAFYFQPSYLQVLQKILLKSGLSLPDLLFLS